MLSTPFSLLFLAFGNIFIKDPPPTIDKWYGFRTKKSMKNEANWLYAQKLSGKYFKKMAIPIFIIGIIFCVSEVYVLVHLKSTDIFTYFFIAEGVLLVLATIAQIPLINSKLD